MDAKIKKMAHSFMPASKYLYFVFRKLKRYCHREAVGGLWDIMGKLQIDFMIKQGLKPEHYFLDIGCGSLRGGIHFIRYLEAGHYYGIDKDSYLLKAGRDIELKRAGLSDKRPQLLLSANFDLSSIPDDKFDFMLAQSLFTHLPMYMIELCLINVMPKLKTGGVFYATFNESNDGQSHLAKPHSNKNDEFGFTSYPFSSFSGICCKIGISISYLGDWNHPRGQKMLVFRKSPIVA